MDDNSDIESVISELNDVKDNVDHAELLRNFIASQSDKIISFLNELKESRNKATSDAIALIREKSHRVVVEGFSENNVNDAFSDALDKVTPYFSEHHDVSITVLGMNALPKGGYRATLEVHVSPMKMKLSDDIESPEEELKRIKDSNSLAAQSKETLHMQNLVHNHFLMHSGYLSYIPDNFLIHVHDANALNMMIEQQFSNVANVNATDDPVKSSPRVTVRVLEPDKGSASK